MQAFFASIFIFGLLIVFHELGHFIFAKLVGIKVHEFSIGFGPRLIGCSRGETRYNLRLFPLGGFVRMAGMDPEEKVEDESKSFNNKPILQRMMVISAGPLMNFFLAVLLLAFIFMTQGIPAPTTTISKLVPGGPAEKSGILPGDKIVAIDNQKVNKWEEMSSIINARPKERLVLTLLRDGVTRKVQVVTIENEHGQGKIGIYPVQEMKRLDLFKAFATGTEYTFRVTVLIISFIGKMVTGQAQADLGGPVRIVWEINKAAELGIYSLLQLAAFLSINLGLFNLFPIPALDGSRVMFLVVEWLRGRPVDPVKENFIHLVGFGLLLLFIIIITYKDILQLFQK